TLITAPPDTIFKAISSTRQAMQQNPGNVLGMHLEGPFLHPEKRGAHKEALLRKPDDGLLQELISEGKDVIRVMTIAPDLFSDKRQPILSETGNTLAGAHSRVGREAALASCEKGVGVVTHLY